MFYSNVKIEWPLGFGSMVKVRDGGRMESGCQWVDAVVAPVLCRDAADAADWGMDADWAEDLFSKGFIVAVIDDESGYDFLITDPAWAVLTPVTG